MTSKHTPGPWSINTAGIGVNGEFVMNEIYVYNPAVACGVAIAADIIDPETGEPSEANARLIASAPELLEALESILSDACDNGAYWDKARAAIAKARGETC